MSLGRLRGAAWLGQPLDVAIQIQLDEGESPAALCFEAEVFHGDVRQDAARVRVSVENTADARQVQLRLQSGTPVDEPVVTVYGRETCLSKSTRRYVLLSEIPTEVVVASAISSSAAVAAMPSSASITAPVAAASSVPASSAAGAERAASTASAAEPTRPRPVAPAPAVVKPKPVEKSVAPQTAAAPAKPVASAPPAKAQAKLKLDPVETLSERVAMLETRQADAPATSASDVQRLKKLEDSLQNLVSLAAKNERAMAELRERLQQAEAEKYDNPLVYGLAGVLLAALGAGGYLWRRQQQRASRQGPWWRGSQATAGPDAGPGSTANVPVGNAPAAGLTAGVMAATMLAAEELVPPQPPAQPSIGETDAIEPDEIVRAQTASEIDLDDLLLPGEVVAESMPEAVTEVQAQEPVLVEESVVPEFPSLGEVSIDVSHLSLSPVEVAAPAATAPLLDFDLTPAAPAQELGIDPKPDRGTSA